MSGWTHIYDILDPDWDIVKFPNTFGRDPNSPSKFGEWMRTHFGSIDYRASAGKWRYSIQDVWKDGTMHLRVKFRNPRDAMLFKLRWL
jgi:hypothetical protein